MFTGDDPVNVCFLPDDAILKAIAGRIGTGICVADIARVLGPVGSGPFVKALHIGHGC